MTDREIDLQVASLLGLTDVHIECPHCKRGRDEVGYAMEDVPHPQKFRCEQPSGKYVCDWRFLACPLYTQEISSAWVVRNFIVEKWYFSQRAIFKKFLQRVVSERVGVTGGLIAPEEIILLIQPKDICLAALRVEELFR